MVRGSCAADQALHSQALPVVEVCSPLFATLRVQVVDKYKHLGSYNTGHNRYELESNVRTVQAWSAFKPLKKKVIKEQGIDFSQRLQAWNSLCASRLLFHCATWGYLSSVPLQNLSSCYHSFHRQLLTRSKHEGTRTNDGVRSDAQVLPLP